MEGVRELPKVFHFSEADWATRRTGVGRARHLQREALRRAGYEEAISYSFEECDLVHVNTTGPGALLTLVRAKMAKKPVVISAHTTMEDFEGSFRFSYTSWILRSYRALLRFFYNHADMVVAPTEYVKKQLRSSSYGVRTPIEVVSNGVDTELFSPASSEKCRSATRKMILSIGLQVERKGLLEFVDLARRMPEYDFVWVGKTSRLILPLKMVRAIRSGRGLPNMRFAGYVDNEKLPSLYRSCDLFLFLSREETEGIVVLEALACGCNIVVNDIGAFRGWLENGRECRKVPCFVGLTEGERERTLEAVSLTIKECVEGDSSLRRKNARRVSGTRSLEEVGTKLACIYERVLVATRREER